MSKTKYSVLVLILIGVLCVSAAFAASITVNPTADTTVGYGFGQINGANGSGAWLANQSVSYWPFWSEILMSFDLSAIPDNAVVTSATFGWLYVYPATDGDTPTGRTNLFHQCTGSWDEATVTYTNAPAAGDRLFVTSTGPNWPNVGTWQIATSDLADSDVDNNGLANWVQAAIADNTLATNGWRIYGPQDSNCGANYASSETTTAPYLTIEYNIVPEPSSILALAVGFLPLIIRKKRG